LTEESSRSTCNPPDKVETIKEEENTDQEMITTREEITETTNLEEKETETETEMETEDREEEMEEVDNNERLRKSNLLIEIIY